MEAADARGPVVVADADPGSVARLTAFVDAGSPAETEFAGHRLRHRTDGEGGVTAAQHGDDLVCRWSPHTSRLVIAGLDETTLARPRGESGRHGLGTDRRVSRPP